MSMTTTIIAVITPHVWLDHAPIVDVHDVEIDGMARVAPIATDRKRRRERDVGSFVLAVSEMPRDGFPDESPKLLFSHDRRAAGLLRRRA
jgi:hypothetical protein